ncbi:DUF4233 domain-containing protein [Demequina sp. SO4-13]|uniref:DUF4233 domain-containing protein n=1 Tax=Demequina sp. SO4-13 TaxID=3401027 RepID=UPI003AF9BF15
MSAEETRPGAARDSVQQGASDAAPEPSPEQSAATQRRPQRPATLVFTQSVLALQAFVALFATLVAWSFARNGLVEAPAGWVAGGGAALMVMLFYAAGKQKKRWGRALAWVLQVPMLVAGLLVPAIAALGVVFLMIWIMALRLGSRIDRERKERDEAAAARSNEDTQVDGRMSE